jgi:hypothetical protein
MVLKKLHNSFSEEELLNLLDQKETTEVKEDPKLEYRNDIPLFLSAYNVLPGEHCVSKRVLLELYRAWSNKSVRPSTFYYHISKYLIIHQKGPKHYYLINESAINISTKAYALVKENSIDKTKSPTYKKHFEQFLKDMNIVPGDYYVETFILFKVYDNWHYSKKMKKNPLGNTQLFNYFKLYFTHRRKTDSQMQWFAVDRSILNNFTEQQLERIKTAYYGKKRKNKKK